MSMKVLKKLEKELEEMYEFNTKQFDYVPNPDGRGMYACNKEWRGSTEQKQLYKKINQQLVLINKRKRKLGIKEN